MTHAQYRHARARNRKLVKRLRRERKLLAKLSPLFPPMSVLRNAVTGLTYVHVQPITIRRPQGFL